ncbi:kinesin-like protein KIN-10C [Lolium rigidum]|uniref:kinesin-like protein KIN-10C n=1 Tax=Lolium rigidum TaxID=89674 RepID=UPI001F5CE390|nr:kinesin-like protein KIN-10C [Lolium rigidum]
MEVTVPPQVFKIQSESSKASSSPCALRAALLHARSPSSSLHCPPRTCCVNLHPMASAAAAGAASSQRVRVVLRLRPFLPLELEAGSAAAPPCVTVIGGRPGSEVTVQLKDPRTSRSKCYKLDAFFGHEDRVRDIFDKEISAVIPGIFEGVNATVFACGATGSGKTYTMQGTEDLPGLIPLAVSTVLKLGIGTSCSLEISYYEVYMGRCQRSGRCFDLLEPKDTEIMALDDQDGNLQLKGLAWKDSFCLLHFHSLLLSSRMRLREASLRIPSPVPVPRSHRTGNMATMVSSMEEFQQVYSKGEQRRNVSHTDLNDVSSRSHAVLSIRVNNDAVTGKLNLIDLAGNEDKTCNEGIRSSLFVLSNVISALKNNESRIPYRDSKLTRILQDSLGGNSRAVMIACLNPMEYHEALHTVNLAGRSGHIKQTASARVFSRVKVMNQYDENIKKMLFDSVDHTPAKNRTRLSSQDAVKDYTMFYAVVPPSSTPCKEDKFESPISKALSPISPNMVILRQQTYEDLDCPPSLEPKTPIGACNIAGMISSATPLDKLNAHGSDLMESYIQQYLEFLNVASKEDLQEVKGIGEKRAEYIVELRKDSPRPFKSLLDMENIGLSTKQIQSLMLKTATGIFEQSLERSVGRHAGDTSQHRRRIN